MKIPGRYKGTRKHKAPPVRVRMQCPGCNWVSDILTVELADQQYMRHLVQTHFGAFHCSYCSASFPDFTTLGVHIKDDHDKKKPPAWVQAAYGTDDLTGTYLGDTKLSWPCPVYFTILSTKGEEVTGYICPRCGLTFVRKKPCLMHMGFVMNIPASCMAG